MKKLIYTLVFLLVTLGSVKNSTAAVGLDMSYVCTSKSLQKYNFTVALYRDCSEGPAPVTLTLKVTSASLGYAASYIAKRTSSTYGTDSISHLVNLCASLSSTCTGGTYPGYDQTLYDVSFNLPNPAADWVVSVMDSNRSAAITNLANPESHTLYSECRINNSIPHLDHSPVFSSLPIAQACVSEQFQYSLGTRDADGDSLVYFLVQPLEGPGQPIPYSDPGFTPTHPLSTKGGIFIFGLHSGEMLFSADKTQVAIISVRTDEYRNGVKIGSIQRDIMVNATQCSNQLPQIQNGLENIVNGFQNSPKDNIIRTCPNTALSFDITGFDRNAEDAVTIQTNLATSIPGAHFNTSGTNPVIGHFSWTPTDKDAGFYEFTVIVKDNQCPIFGQQMYTFGIHVKKSYANAGSDTTVCSQNAVVQLHASGEKPINWSNGKYLNNDTIRDPIASLPGPGTYSFVLTTDQNSSCEAKDKVTIKVTSDVNVEASAAPDSICKGTEVNLTAKASGGNGVFTYKWTSNPAGFQSTRQNNKVSPNVTTTYYVEVESGGCVVNDTVTVTVNPSPSAAFTALPNSGCDSLTVFFQSNASGSDSVSWDFGDGTTSTEHNPSHTYHAGTYTVTLTVTNIYGCSGTLTIPDYIKVSNGSSNASIIASDTSGCAPLTVNFQGKPDSASYAWDFGDGSGSIEQNPSHTFSTNGIFVVTLTVNGSECPAHVIIRVSSPSASFSASPASGCDPLTVAFSNTSTGADSFMWLFGDGTTSNLKNPTHIYHEGTYSVTLIAQSSDGCSDTLTLSDFIHVGTIPTINISASDTAGCEPLTVFFTSGSGGDTYLWSFGDSTSSTDSDATHTYSAGDFTVTLTVTNNGCSATQSIADYIHVKSSPVVSFSGSPQSGCDSALVVYKNNSTNADSYTWLFGDGTSSSEKNPMHKYLIGNYTVTLIAYNSNGCSDTLILPDYIVVSPRPSVTIAASDTAGCEPLTVQFSNSSGSGGTYLWDFGDGSTSTLPNPIHTYSAGIYTVALTVSNGLECSAKETIVDYIKVLPSPVASFFGTPVSGCDPLTVQFTNNSTGASSYVWIFGDGNTSTEISPSHLYHSGTYDVILIATNLQGCSDTLILSQYIKVSSMPVVSFTADPLFGCNPLTVNFTNNSTGGSNYFWDFGDSTTSTGINPSHTYTAGSYNVTLTVTADSGCSASQTSTQLIVVSPSPTVAFGAAPTAGCEPLNVQFTNNSTGGTAYLWDFGDGTTSTEISPAHTYNGGTYDVTLTVLNDSGCSATLTLPQLIQVDSNAIAFIASDTSGCDPLTVQFQNLTPNGTSFSWDFGDGTTSTEQNPQHVYHQGVYNVTLSVTTSSGCSGSVTYLQYIKVYSKPISSFTTTENTSDPIDISQATIHFNNTSQGADSYAWDFGDGTVSNDVSPTHTYTAPDTVFVTLIAYNGSCSDTAILGPIVIVKQDDIFFPSAFTPNNDGKNDYFHEMIQVGISTLDFAIFDRWGNMVFQTNDPKGKWDGEYKSEIADVGVYVWYAKATLLNGKEITKHGNVSLLR